MKLEKFNLKIYKDDRGTLIPIEGRDHNFSIERIFTLSDCREERGGHAHKYTNQLAFVPQGNCTITTLDIEGAYRVHTLAVGEAIFIPKMTFVETIELDPTAVLVILADTNYNYHDSIRNKMEFLKIINS